MLQLFPRYDVVALAGPTPQPFPGRPGAGLVPVGLDSAIGPKEWFVNRRVFGVLATHGVRPTQTATDFYRVAASAYAADLRVPRASGFDRWSREITLHVPVADPKRWDTARPALLALLGFLTGDRWAVAFRHAVVPPPPVTWRRRRGAPPPVPPPAPNVDAVCLLSGGLDSGVGALDALAAGRSLALVSHNAKGDDAFSKAAQLRVARRLARAFAGRAHHLQFRLDPPRPDHVVTTSETTQRSRSIIFLALGILVASGLPAGTPLVIPENGLISLNVPLTNGRLGSWSTRTTHPHTLALVREVLEQLEIATPFETPYRFATKGEMLRDCADPTLGREIARDTVSCAHPSQFRYEPDPSRRRHDMPHCGTCVPCLIRRAALARVGWDGDDRYRVDAIREADVPLVATLLRGERGADLRAFRIAVARRAAEGTRAADLLRSGSLHVATGAEMGALVRVQDEGLAEVGRMLAGASGWDAPAERCAD